MAGQRLPQTTPRFAVRHPCENPGVEPNDWNFRTALRVWLLSRLKWYLLNLHPQPHHSPNSFGKSATAPCGKQILDTESRPTTWPRSVRIGRLRPGRHLFNEFACDTVLGQSPAITGIDFWKCPKTPEGTLRQQRTHIFKGFSVPRSRSPPAALSGTTELKISPALA